MSLGSVKIEPDEGVWRACMQIEADVLVRSFKDKIIQRVNEFFNTKIEIYSITKDGYYLFDDDIFNNVVKHDDTLVCITNKKNSIAVTSNGKKRKKEKKEKRPGNPLKAFTHYHTSEYNKVKAKDKSVTRSSMKEGVTEKWNKLSEEEKKPWYDMEKLDKARYRREIEIYYQAHPEERPMKRVKQEEYICETCGRQYTMKNVFDKHIIKCKQEKEEEKKKAQEEKKVQEAKKEEAKDKKDTNEKSKKRKKDKKDKKSKKIKSGETPKKKKKNKKKKQK